MNTLLISNNKTYDRLKFFSQIILPAIGALYFGLAEIWGLPYGPEIVGTLVVIDAFLGATLGVSAKAYNAQGKQYAGAINVVETPDTKQFQLEFDGDPYDLDLQDEVRLRINRHSE